MEAVISQIDTVCCCSFLPKLAMHLNILKKSQFYTYVYMHFNAVEVNSLFNTITSDFPCPYFPFRLDQGILFLQKINILVTDVLSLFT